MSEAGTEADAVQAFFAAVRADPALQAEFAGFEELTSFLPVAVPRAQALGFSLSTEALRDALRPAPVGMERYTGGPPTLDVPPPGWLPVSVAPMYGQVCVDWAWFGARPFDDPFYEASIRYALGRPLSRMMPTRTLLGNLPGLTAQLPVLTPAAFIFHMSRCGSTLVSQMLAAEPRNLVLSEAAPFDSVLQLDRMVQGLSEDVHIALLRAMAGVLGQKRVPGQERVIFKTDSWHSMALPLLTKAFPDVPWVFIYREPVEVLASQVLERGMQTLPEFMPPAVYGLRDEDAEDSTIYCAKLLAATCTAVLEPFKAGGGLLVNYRELPDAVFTKILPHFGVTVGDEVRAAMSVLTRFHAKTPGIPFETREAAKAEVIDAALRAHAQAHMMPVYRELERLRGAG